VCEKRGKGELVIQDSSALLVIRRDKKKEGTFVVVDKKKQGQYKLSQKVKTD